MNCVEAVQVREMEKSYHEYAEVRALTPLTLRCLSQNISSRVNFITFRVIFQMEDIAFEDFWSGALVNFSFILG